MCTEDEPCFTPDPEIAPTRDPLAWQVWGGLQMEAHLREALADEVKDIARSLALLTVAVILLSISVTVGG